MKGQNEEEYEGRKGREKMREKRLKEGKERRGKKHDGSRKG